MLSAVLSNPRQELIVKYKLIEILKINPRTTDHCTFVPEVSIHNGFIRKSMGQNIFLFHLHLL